MSTPLGSVGKYELRRQLGRGAMGVVYEAFDTVIERKVALKLLRTEVFAPEQLADVRTRFKREAHSAGKLSHPNIVTIFDYGEHEGAPYIVMDLMSGSELAKKLEAGARLPIKDTARIITDLLAALAYAHDGGVVHRDIKPSNLFLLTDGTLKVVDFGVARIESSELTETGAILGTPAYMSPEQFVGMPVDGRSDLFSVGVILYQLLTGDRPFSGSPTTIMQKVLRQDPIEPTSLNPTLAPDWDTVIKRALAKKPEQRFQTARQFADAIRFVMEGKRLPEAKEFLSDTTVQVAPERSGAAAPRSHAMLYVIAGLGVAAIGLGGVALYVFRPQPTAPAIVAAVPTPPKPVPVAEPPKPVEAPKPVAVVEPPKPVEAPKPVEPPPPPKPVVEAPKPKPKPVEKKPVVKPVERPKVAVVEAPPPKPAPVVEPPKPVAKPAPPAAPALRATVVSLDRSWGFAVIELAERGSVKLGDRLTATVAGGRRVDMVVKRVSGNLASAVPDGGKLTDDLVGASVTRN